MTAFAPLLGLLADVPDPRRGQGQLYQLPYVLLFSILAIVTGCNSYRGVVTFIDVHRHKLNATFGLKWRRAPADTAVRDILKRLDPADVEVAFRRHAALLQAARATPGTGSIALDGKTLRGSLDNFNDRVAAQVLSAFATDTSLVLVLVLVLRMSISTKNPTKSRRRRRCSPNSASPPAASSRSMRCTVKKTFRGRRTRRRCPDRPEPAPAKAGVKDNQPTLHRQIEDIAATTAPRGCAHRHDTGRNRDERRTVTVFDPANKLAGTDWHPHVAAIIRVERDVFIRNSKTGLLRHASETAFYISNKPLDAPRAAEAVRAHCGIQTTSHYTRDVTFAEDRSRFRTNPGVFARIRSFGFNILKANRTDTTSQDRYRAALAGIENLGNLVAIS